MTVLMGSARFLGATHSAWDSLGTEARSFLPAARRSFHDTGFRSRSNFGSGCNLAIAILPSQQSSHGLSMDRRRHAETVVGGMSLLYWQFLQAQCPSADPPATYQRTSTVLYRKSCVVSRLGFGCLFLSISGECTRFERKEKVS